MDEPDHAKIAHAIGTDLRERYANALREPFPTHLTGLLAYLAVVEAIGPEHAGEQQSRSESANPARSTEAAYEQAIEMAAQCMLTVARTDEVATAAQAWMLQALRLRGGLADGEQVDRTVLRNVFEDAVSMAVAKALDQALPQILGHSGEVARVEGTVADGLRQNLQRIAEQFPGVHWRAEVERLIEVAKDSRWGHRASTCIRYGIQPKDIADRLYLDSGRDNPINLATEDKSGFSVETSTVDALLDALITRQIDVLVIDPFVSSHSIHENDNAHLNAVVKELGRIAEQANCAVELVHHVRKGARGQSEHSVDDGRGAGALLAAARSARVLNTMSEREAEEYDVKQHERRLFFRVENGKANLARPSGLAVWHRHESISIGNGDDVGVVTRWNPTSIFENVTPQHLEDVKKLLDEGDYRESAQADDWAGNVVAKVLGLNLTAAAKKRAKALLRHWTSKGVLAIVEKQDKHRNMRRFIKPAAPWKSKCSTMGKSTKKRSQAAICCTAAPHPLGWCRVPQRGSGDILVLAQV
jgi:hypothetical protein